MDGHDSAKAIRSFERSHSSDIVSRGHSPSPMCCVPILAVSASLSEKERDDCMVTGFDGWITKPISFDRLQHITAGVADLRTRREDLYQPGSWERGGWFREAQEDLRSCGDGNEK